MDRKSYSLYKQKPLPKWLLWVIVILLALFVYSRIFTRPSPDLAGRIAAIPAAAQVSHEDETYLDFVERTSSEFADNGLVFTTQLQKVLNDQKIIYDEKWLDDMAVNIVNIRSVCQECIDYDTARVPPEFDEFHSEYTEAARQYLGAFDIFVQAIENDSDDLFTEFNQQAEEAVQHMETAVSYISIDSLY